MQGSHKLESLVKQIKNNIEFKEEWNSSGTAMKVIAEIRYSNYAIVRTDCGDIHNIREYQLIKEQLVKQLLDKIYSPVYEPVYYLLNANKSLLKVSPTTIAGLFKMLDTINPIDLNSHEGINYIVYMEDKIKDLQAEVAHLTNVLTYR